ncbi:hypothetical protein QFZ70_000656 [Arthrobacter sp. V1I9]|jgi:hypothetical protein|uniref:hypothetical protein n=1 Tax=Arthrobacter sp. V1I9 TaxID=3042275 RepID=UPI00279093A1|nr:hypothetical protein [Arthrobacter sp. V1I9]MDQ0868183.1 hypothetical protein [Arthrobacter sp. V1I9]
MAPRVRVLSSALLRAGLVAAVLAVMAGILGMHVMTADHSSHAAGPAAAGSVAGSTAAAAAGGHSDHSHHPGHTAVAHSAGGYSDHSRHPGHPAGSQAEPAIQAAEHASLTAADVCGSACPGIEESGASCIPLATTGSLAVFPPKGAAGGEPNLTVHARHVRAYSFTPSSPTPCELSISRT